MGVRHGTLNRVIRACLSAKKEKRGLLATSSMTMGRPVITVKRSTILHHPRFSSQICEASQLPHRVLCEANSCLFGGNLSPPPPPKVSVSYSLVATIARSPRRHRAVTAPHALAVAPPHLPASCCHRRSATSAVVASPRLPPPPHRRAVAPPPRLLFVSRRRAASHTRQSVAIWGRCRQKNKICRPTRK